MRAEIVVIGGYGDETGDRAALYSLISPVRIPVSVRAREVRGWSKRRTAAVPVGAVDRSYGETVTVSCQAYRSDNRRGYRFRCFSTDLNSLPDQRLCDV